MDEKFIYSLGQRDAIAMILAENNKKIKLKDLAELYAKTYGEEHFSHKWHTS